MSVFGVILVRERYGEIRSISPIQFECGKMRTRITPNTDTFYAVAFCNYHATIAETRPLNPCFIPDGFIIILTLRRFFFSTGCSFIVSKKLYLGVCDSHSTNPKRSNYESISRGKNFNGVTENNSVIELMLPT